MERRKRELETFIIILAVLGVLAAGALLFVSLVLLLDNINVGAAIYSGSAVLGSCIFALISISALIYVHRSQRPLL